MTFATLTRYCWVAIAFIVRSSIAVPAPPNGAAVSALIDDRVAILALFSTAARRCHRRHFFEFLYCFEVQTWHAVRALCQMEPKSFGAKSFGNFQKTQEKNLSIMLAGAGAVPGQVQDAVPKVQVANKAADPGQVVDKAPTKKKESNNTVLQKRKRPLSNERNSATATTTEALIKELAIYSPSFAADQFLYASHFRMVKARRTTTPTCEIKTTATFLPAYQDTIHQLLEWTRRQHTAFQLGVRSGTTCPLLIVCGRPGSGKTYASVNAIEPNFTCTYVPPMPKKRMIPYLWELHSRFLGSHRGAQTPQLVVLRDLLASDLPPNFLSELIKCVETSPTSVSYLLEVDDEMAYRSKQFKVDQTTNTLAQVIKGMTGVTWVELRVNTRHILEALDSHGLGTLDYAVRQRFIEDSMLDLRQLAHLVDLERLHPHWSAKSTNASEIENGRRFPHVFSLLSCLFQQRRWTPVEETGLTKELDSWSRWLFFFKKWLGFAVGLDFKASEWSSENKDALGLSAPSLAEQRFDGLREWESFITNPSLRIQSLERLRQDNQKQEPRVEQRVDQQPTVAEVEIMDTLAELCEDASWLATPVDSVETVHWREFNFGPEYGVCHVAAWKARGNGDWPSPEGRDATSWIYGHTRDSHARNSGARHFGDDQPMQRSNELATDL